MFFDIARVIKKGRCLFLDSCQKHGKNFVVAGSSVVLVLMYLMNTDSVLFFFFIEKFIF